MSKTYTFRRPRNGSLRSVHPAPALPELRLDFATYNPLSLLVRQRGWLEEEFRRDGIGIRWVQSLGSNRALEHLAAGTAHFGSSAGAAALVSRINGSPVRSIYVYSKPEWTALVTRKDTGIADPANLRGRRVAATRGTDPHIFLVRALAQAGLREADIELVPLQHGEGLQALLEARVDAWAGLDPFMAQAEVDHGAKLFFRRPEWNTYGALTTTESFAADYPAVVERVLAIYERARLHARENPAELRAALMSAAYLSEAVAERQLERTDFSNSSIGALQKETILAAGLALQAAGAVKADVDVTATASLDVMASFSARYGTAGDKLLAAVREERGNARRPLGLSGPVFADASSHALLDEIDRIAASLVNVLILGETGVGKELVARHLHAAGSRRHHPFVAVNCAALSESLFESELFGHERGAFTGAHAGTPGWFEAANGGTLFLDEIGELAPAMQAKLLRVIQEREVTRVGARVARPVDVRLVTATNVDLESAVRDGRFREDLYYRIKVATLQVSPLRARRGDILPIARQFCRRYGPPGIDIALSPDAEAALLRHDWPGNIRELENVIQSALAGFGGRVLTAGDLPIRHLAAGGTLRQRRRSTALERVFDDLLAAGEPELFDLVQRTLVERAFAFNERNQVHTAASLGITRNVLRTLLQRHGVGGRMSEE